MVNNNNNKQSYSSRLVSHLNEVFDGKKQKGHEKFFQLVTSEIKKFATLESKRIHEEQKLTANQLSWGKYKGLTFEKIGEINPKYLDWLSTNKKYLNASQQTTLDEVIRALDAVAN